MNPRALSLLSAGLLYKKKQGKSPKGSTYIVAKLTLIRFYLPPPPPLPCRNRSVQTILGIVSAFFGTMENAWSFFSCNIFQFVCIGVRSIIC